MDYTAPWMKRTLSVNNEVVYLNPNDLLAVPHVRKIRSLEGARKAKYILAAFYDNEPTSRSILRLTTYQRAKVNLV